MNKDMKKMRKFWYGLGDYQKEYQEPSQEEIFFRDDLPSSKVDFWGAGVSRSLSCTCAAGNRLGMPCVACRVTEQVVQRERQGAGPEAPLFPDSSDRFPSKLGATQTLARL